MNKKILDEVQGYCLNCVNKACSQKGCPLGNDIPQFIHAKNTKEAFEILSKTTVLPAICGRVCPHSKQCQGVCIRGIKGEPVSIGKMESYIGDVSIKEKYKIEKEMNDANTKENIKVAVIGGGPAGLTCAAFLAKKNIKVTIYEKNSKLGGLLSYGIPDFRLDRKIIEDTITKILELGIIVETNKELGKDISLKSLQEEYDAVFIAIGANKPQMTLKGQNILSANTLLENINILKYEENKEIEDNINSKRTINEKEKRVPNFKNKKVAINGGGNVAMDVARTVKRLGADVTVIYRRAEEQMPAELEEIKKAKEEGIKFLFKTNILSVESKNKEIECIKTKLVNKDGETRLSPVDIIGSNYKLEMDYVILATGSKTDQNIIKGEKLEENTYGYLKVDDKYRTSLKNVFAGGDVIGTKATVAWAAKNGREAAFSIIENLKTN